MSSVSRRAGRAALAGVALLGLLWPALAAALKVTGVTPSGEVAEVRQVVVRFDAPAIAMGDLRGDGARAPFTLQCSGRGGAVQPGADARWIDAQRWAIDLREPLSAGTRCTLAANPAFVPLGGGTIDGAREFTFSTGAPTVTSIQPWPGSQIAEDQHFLLLLNGEVDPAGLAKNVWCETDGVGERLAVRRIEGEPLAQVLRQRRRGLDPKRALLLACERPFAPEAAVRLVWGAGIAAAGQPALATRAPRQWQWTVRPRLLADFSCERENANAPCLPLKPMTLRFNAPVPKAAALGARLVPAAGGNAIAAVASEYDKGDTVNEVRFPAPLPENARFRIELPADLKDDAGRALANAASFPLQVATGGLPPLAKFAAAPLAVLEAGTAAEPALLPLTLRHVQADLANASTGGKVAIRRLDASVPDAELLAWIGRLNRFHESEISAKDAGRPQAEWFITETEPDARGRPRTVKRERMLATREVSLLAADSAARRAELPQLKDTTPRATEVLGVPLPSRGLHVVEVESRILGDSLLAQRAPMFVRTGALVTNLGVHFKRGRSSSLVWVTTLDRARPVAGARVAVNDCRGKPLWSGITDAAGIARIERGFDGSEGGDIGTDDATRRCATDDGLFVTARAADPKAPNDPAAADVAFVFSRWSKGIEPWRFNIPTASGVIDAASGAERRAHTVFDRTLLRAGETVSMKHFVREETERGLALPKPEALPREIVITHVGSGAETTLPLAWPRGARAAESRWIIPKTATLGLYDVVMKSDERRWGTGSFRVEAFRVPLVDARLAPPRGAQVAPGELAFDAQLNAMAGGPMPGRALALSALLRERTPRFAGFDDFTFEPPRPDNSAEAAAPPREGDEAPGDGATLVADKLPATTDAKGAARIALPKLPALRAPSELVAELAFDDPNGERQTVAQRVPLWPAAVVAGIRLPGWAASRGEARATAVVLDTDGKPLAGREVEVIGRLEQVISSRKRIVGGFYAYDNRREVKELGSLCSGKTDAQGRLACPFKLEVTGEVQLIARAKDDAGRTSEAATSLWVVGEERLWFAQDNDDRIDVLPERREVEPGQTAKLQVRMPFAQATALVTVEREGVIDARVVTLMGRDPIVEVPIPKPGDGNAASWAPNVHVGVFVLRGRLREAPWWSIFTWGWRDPADWWRAFRYEGREWRAPTAMVDLAKPTFKFGVATLKVGLADQRLDVKVQPEKATYGVRETVKTLITVSHGGKPAANAEVAFAAVDEGLLALAPNDSWNLLDGLWQPRPWGVETATATSEIVGRRHYGRKALPPGGGGGRNPTRELFDTLLLWRGTVQLDANGQARIEVPLNDSLTSFRLVAIADDGLARFGTGSASVRTSQDLQMLAGLAPLVREGDRIDAGFTLRNTTNRAMSVKATLAGTAEGGAAPAKPLSFAPQTVALAAGAAAEVRWAVEVPEGTARIVWEASADEAAASGTAPARDRLRIVQAVQSPVPLRVWQSTLLPLEAAVSIPIAPPEGALGGQGGVRAALLPKLTGALPGVRRWFESYPYSCLEQKASRAIGLGDTRAWAALRDEAAGYLDADGLAGYFPPGPGAAAFGSDRLTAHLIATAHEAGWAWPDAVRDAMLGGLVAFVEGRLERRFPSPKSDLDARRLAALEALSRHGRAEPRHLGTIGFNPAAMGTWPTSALLDAWAVLRRMANAPQRAERLAQVESLLRSRLIEGGTTLAFSTEASDDWWWLMDGPDANAARLVLAALDAAAASPGSAWAADLPRLVNGTLARQQRGAWRTTTANVWGVLALEKFGRRFEAQAVGGRSTFALGATTRSFDWAASPGGSASAPGTGARPVADDTLLLPWPGGGGAASAAATPPIAFTARHDGPGRPWLTVQTLAAVPLRAPLSAGYRITRSLVPVERKVPDGWSRGDVVRVRLEIEAMADMAWVVASDPVPAGATVLGSGLGRDSAIATRGERREGSAWLAYEERGADAWRAYWQWMPRGRHVVEYTVRLNSSGRFGLPPARVEAMYAPESFAEVPVAALEVRP